jgi:hypothetical protein
MIEYTKELSTEFYKIYASKEYYRLYLFIEQLAKYDIPAYDAELIWKSFNTATEIFGRYLIEYSKNIDAIVLGPTDN